MIEFFFILTASVLLSYFFVTVYIENVKEKRNFEEQNNQGLYGKEYLKREWAKILNIFDRLIVISRKNYEDTKQSRINFENLVVADVVLKPFSPNSPHPSESLEVESLKKIPGIGSALANKLLNKFHSIELIQNAKIDNILEVKGISIKLAEKIRHYLQQNNNNKSKYRL